MSPVSGATSRDLSVGAPSSATGAAKAGAAQAASVDERLEAQCRQFEGLLLHLMLKQMRRTVSEAGGLMGHSSAERMTRDMFDERLADCLSQRGALGIGAALLERLQSEESSGAAADPAFDGHG